MSGCHLFMFILLWLLERILIWILATLLLFWIMYMPESKRTTPTCIFKCLIVWRVKIDLDHHHRSQFEHMKFWIQCRQLLWTGAIISDEEKGAFIANENSLAQNAIQCPKKRLGIQCPICLQSHENLFAWIEMIVVELSMNIQIGVHMVPMDKAAHWLQPFIVCRSFHYTRVHLVFSADVTTHLWKHLPKNGDKIV